MVKNDKSLPKMERKVGYIELSQSSIQFMLWEIHSVSKQ